MEVSPHWRLESPSDTQIAQVLAYRASEVLDRSATAPLTIEVDHSDLPSNNFGKYALGKLADCPTG